MFEETKRIVARGILLAYTVFNKEFKIYTDARKFQSEAVISQDFKPIAFYNRNVTDTQTRYTVT